MKKNRVINIYISSFIIAFVFANINIYLLNKFSMPYIMEYANMQTRRLGIEVLKTTGILEVNKLIKENNSFDIVKDNNGKIQSIDLDTTLANEALILISKNVRARLKQIEKGENLPEELSLDNNIIKNNNGIIYEIPYGVIYDNVFLMNFGPKIPVKIKYLGNVGLDVKTRIKEYGLNSALLEVYVKIEVLQKTMLPFNSKNNSLVAEIPIIMKVIKGDIPNYISSIDKGYKLPFE